MSAAAAQLGLTPSLLERLRALGLVSRRIQSGPGAGRRRSPRAGSSAELMDYKSYSPGDDLRRVDWNVYARLDRLFLRVYRAEENLRVRLLVDDSRSMAEGGKFDLARSLAAALAYVALVRYDQVEVATCGGPPQWLAPARGAGAAERVWRFLAGLVPAAAGDLNRAVATAGLRGRTSGLTLVLTDGLFPGGCTASLGQLQAAGHDLVLVQILSAAELAPDTSGDWRLVDSEGVAPAVEVSLAPATVEAYRRRLQAYTQNLQDYCRRRGIAYLLLPAATDLPAAVLALCRQAGIAV